MSNDLTIRHLDKSYASYLVSMYILQVTEGSVCAVWGLGAIGLATLMGCRAAKAKRVIAVDINPMKFEVGNIIIHYYCGHLLS